MSQQLRWPDKLGTEQRIKAAKQKVARLVDDMRALLQVHEANRIIVYSDRLSTQVGRSFAANAFNSFQRSALFELVRLCAAWDTPKEDRYSIPSAILLV